MLVLFIGAEVLVSKYYLEKEGLHVSGMLEQSRNNSHKNNENMALVISMFVTKTVFWNKVHSGIEFQLLYIYSRLGERGRLPAQLYSACHHD